jgi:hypothetical protein
VSECEREGEESDRHLSATKHTVNVGNANGQTNNTSRDWKYTRDSLLSYLHAITQNNR